MNYDNMKLEPVPGVGDIPPIYPRGARFESGGYTPDIWAGNLVERWYNSVGKTITDKLRADLSEEVVYMWGENFKFAFMVGSGNTLRVVITNDKGEIIDD